MNKLLFFSIIPLFFLIPLVYADDCSSWINGTCYNSTHISQTRTCNYTNTTNGTTGVYALYHLNETSGIAVTDSSGNNRNGTGINNPTWVSGKLNNSIQLNGNQAVNLSNTGGFERTDNFSVEAWIYPTTTVGQLGIVSKGLGSGAYTGWSVSVNNQKIYFYMINNFPSNSLVISTTQTYSISSWRHIIVTYDGTSTANGVKIYVNGTLQAQEIGYNTLSGSIINSAKCYIGEGFENLGYFYGKLDEVIIYNKTLTPEDVTARYNNGNGIELDIGGNISGTYNETQYTLNSSCVGLPVYPQYSNIQTEYNNLINSTFRTWNTSSINITWTDANTSIDKVLLEHNFTGSFVNYTLTNYTGDIYNYTFNVTSWNTTICWKSYANSTTPFWNNTGQYCFNVYNTTIPPIPIPPTPIIYYNGSADISGYLTGYCLNNNTLKMNGTYQNQTVEIQKDCIYGCENGDCNPTPIQQYLIIFGVFIGVLILFILLKKAGVFRR